MNLPVLLVLIAAIVIALALLVSEHIAIIFLVIAAVIVALVLATRGGGPRVV